MKHKLLSLLMLAISVFAVSTARADLIYRETFGHANSTADQPLKDFDWGIHVGTGALDGSGQLLVSKGAGKPSGAAAVANVNAGGSVDSLGLGYQWGNLSGVGTGDAEIHRMIVWTPEYSFNPADYVPGSLVFSWHQGNASTADAMRVAVRIAGHWYVSESGFNNTAAVTSGNNFFRGDDQGGGDPTGAHGAELKSFPFTTGASAWRQLNFDGTFSSVTNTGAGGTILSMAGTTLAADLPAGTIDAFGLFTNNPTNGNRRFDTFTISAEPVPEPSTFALIAGGLLVVAIVRRRKA